MWEIRIECCVYGKSCVVRERLRFKTVAAADAFRKAYNEDCSRIHNTFFYIAQGPYAITQETKNA